MCCVKRLLRYLYHRLFCSTCALRRALGLPFGYGQDKER